MVAGYVRYVGSYPPIPYTCQLSHPQCDVILIDGSHEEGPAYLDLWNFRQAAAPHALLILDDMDSEAGRSVFRAYKVCDGRG